MFGMFLHRSSAAVIASTQALHSTPRSGTPKHSAASIGSRHRPHRAIGAMLEFPDSPGSALARSSRISLQRSMHSSQMSTSRGSPRAWMRTATASCDFPQNEHRGSAAFSSVMPSPPNACGSDAAAVNRNAWLRRRRSAAACSASPPVQGCPSSTARK